MKPFQIRRRRLERLGNLPMRSQTDPVTATPTATLSPIKSSVSSSVPAINQSVEDSEKVSHSF